MAWQPKGTYFESCSCDAVCPCTWSALTAKATLDRCRALLAYNVESGQINDVDVSGLNFALFLDTPPVMSQGRLAGGSPRCGTTTTKARLASSTARPGW